MKIIKYFLQFCLIIILFLIFKLFGPKKSAIISGTIFSILGPRFRSKKIISYNLSLAFPNINNEDKKKIIDEMWMSYGEIFSNYIFIKNFRNSNLADNIKIDGVDILENIIKEKKPVVFISGHFNNFELMAMCLEKNGINLAAIYRPLNNLFLNPIMEYIRKKFICSKQVPKGINGTKKILQYFKNGSSIALMIDQRVTQGIKCKFFGKDAYTTTIPAQFFKKFKSDVVPVYIERRDNLTFYLKIYKPIKFNEAETIENITLKLNKILEEMIIKNPSQWIWTHNRWKL